MRPKFSRMNIKINYLLQFSKKRGYKNLANISLLFTEWNAKVFRKKNYTTCGVFQNNCPVLEKVYCFEF